MRKGPGIIDRVRLAPDEAHVNQLLVESVSYTQMSLVTSRRLTRVANRRKDALAKAERKAIADAALGDGLKGRK